MGGWEKSLTWLKLSQLVKRPRLVPSSGCKGNVVVFSPTGIDCRNHGLLCLFDFVFVLFFFFSFLFQPSIPLDALSVSTHLVRTLPSANGLLILFNDLSLFNLDTPSTVCKFPSWLSSSHEP